MRWRDIPFAKDCTDGARDHFIKQWLEDRNRARTDLRWLCHEILGFRDIVEHAHGQIIRDLQKFPGSSEAVDPRKFQVVVSRPRTRMWELQHQKGGYAKRHLLLASRGRLKTTLNSIAHSIQWILQYPDVRILITTATEKLAKEIMGAIAVHFEVNDRMRMLFPEYCAKPGKTMGNSEQFTVPNRSKDAITYKEPTVMLITLDSAMAGFHYDVIKHSDVIDQFNSKTPGGLETIADHFKMCTALLERHESKFGPQRGWRTIEGTIYNYSDFHAELLEKQLERVAGKNQPCPRCGQAALGKRVEVFHCLKEKGGCGAIVKARSWLITRESCWADATKTTSAWPERYSLADLQEMLEENGPEWFANQMELEPMPEGSGLTTKAQLDKLWIPRPILDAITPTLHLHITVDLAGLDKASTGDYTVITLAGFDRAGRMYVLEIHRAHFDGDEVADVLLDIDARYNNRILDVKIEKEAHARGLRSTLEREQALRQQYLIIDYLPRDNQIAKVQRIKDSLKYWFRKSIIRFAEDLPGRLDIENEILRFPKWRYDDILDTLADQTQNQKAGFEPDMLPRPKADIRGHFEPPKFTGFDERGQEVWSDGGEGSMLGFHDEVTGL
jgi:ribosomal protein S27AE